jgi:hypothetical protein
MEQWNDRKKLYLRELQTCPGGVLYVVDIASASGTEDPGSNTARLLEKTWQCCCV